MKVSRLIFMTALILAMMTANVLAMRISVAVEGKVTVDINSPPPPPKRVYTGLIVDCRGLKLQKVMSPVIKNEFGEIIYGDEIADYDRVAEFGMVSYSKNFSNAARAGNKPLVVRAFGTSNFNSAPVLRANDSRRILRENNLSGFLDDAKVVFLTD